MSARPGLDPVPVTAPSGAPVATSPQRRPPAWQLSEFSGRVGEISGGRASAVLTLAFRLVLEAQWRGEPVAWIARRDSPFYPPDAAGSAVDLEALAVVWAPETRSAARAADHLVRSGAVGLVILVLGGGARIPAGLQARLVGLARRHHAAVLFLTEKESDRPSVGSLVSIRAQAGRIRKLEDRFVCEARILKDKRRGPGRTHREICHGPDGLH
jgi:recombination protein RecA